MVETCGLLGAAQKDEVLVGLGDIAESLGIHIDFTETVNLVHNNNVSEVETDAVGRGLRFLRHDECDTFLLCEEVFVLTSSGRSDERADDNRSAHEAANGGDS